MATRQYVPDTGHIIEFHFDVPAGANTPATRPALVLSPAAYNRRTGLVVVCAITRQSRGNPFEVAIGPDAMAILADQVKSLDWKHTRISAQGRVTPAELDQVRQRLKALLFDA